MVQRLLLSAGLLASLAGCGGETVAPATPAENPAALYWRLTLNQQAINLSTAAPYDTFRLVATARDLNGEPLEVAAAPQFASADPEAVQVTPDGLVRGLLEVNRIPIVVTLAHGTLTHVDTSLVSVTTNPTPPAFDSLSLEPNPPDSAKGTGEGGAYYPEPAIVPRTFDRDGNELGGLAVWVESSGGNWSYDNVEGSLGGTFPGPAVFYAHTWAYGVARADTLAYTMGFPLFSASAVETRFVFGSPTPVHQFQNPTITVGTGAYVWWQRANSVPSFDVTFDNSANVAADMRRGALFGCGATAGNIAPFGDGTTNPRPNICSRYFPVPGTYRYHSTVLNASGAVIVVDESQQPLAFAAGPAFLAPQRAPGPTASWGGLRRLVRRDSAGLTLEWP